MENAEAKKYLEKYRFNIRDIADTEEDITRMKNMANRFGKILTDETIAKIRKYILGRRAKQKKLETENAEIKMRIDSMKKETWREILTLRYIEGYDFEKIAEIMCYEYTSALNLHCDVVKRFAQSF